MSGESLDVAATCREAIGLPLMDTALTCGQQDFLRVIQNPKSRHPWGHGTQQAPPYGRDACARV
jgi:hypothetical protein